MRPERAGLGITVALHALVLLGLLSYEPARKSLFSAAPIMIDLITLPKVDIKSAPPVVPPKPLPIAKHTARLPDPSPLLAAPAEAPSPVTAPPQTIQAAPARTPAVASPAPPAVTPPVFDADYLQNPAPAYPAISQRIREQGRVILRVLVSTGGTADEVQLRTSSGFERLDEAARATVRTWEFVPARRGDQPVAAWVMVPISFRLNR